MTDPVIIRCSSTDRAVTCAPSLVKPEAAYNPSNPDATEGTAAHTAMADIVNGEVPDLDGIASEYGLDYDDLAQLVGRATRAWESDIAAWFPASSSEVRMSTELSPAVTLRGTADVTDERKLEAWGIGTHVEALGVLDWKFGWAPSTHTTQIKSYAYLMRAEHGMPSSGFILGIEYWVRPGELKVHRFDDAALDQLRDDLLDAHSRREDGQYGPSADACRYCPRQNECTARADWARSGVSALTVVEPGQIMTRQAVAEVYDRVAEIKKACGQFDKLVKGMLLDGPIELPDGRVVKNVTSEQTQIQASKAVAVLRDVLDLDAAQMDLALGVTKSGLGRALKLYADKGDGAALIRNAMRELDDAGAVSRVEVTKKQTTKEPHSGN